MDNTYIPRQYQIDEYSFKSTREIYLIEQHEVFEPQPQWTRDELEAEWERQREEFDSEF